MQVLTFYFNTVLIISIHVSYFFYYYELINLLVKCAQFRQIINIVYSTLI